MSASRRISIKRSSLRKESSCLSDNFDQVDDQFWFLALNIEQFIDTVKPDYTTGWKKIRRLSGLLMNNDCRRCLLDDESRRNMYDLVVNVFADSVGKTGASVESIEEFLDPTTERFMDWASNNGSRWIHTLPERMRRDATIETLPRSSHHYAYIPYINNQFSTYVIPQQLGSNDPIILLFKHGIRYSPNNIKELLVYGIYHSIVSSNSKDDVERPLSSITGVRLIDDNYDPYGASIIQEMLPYNKVMQITKDVLGLIKYKGKIAEILKSDTELDVSDEVNSLIGIIIKYC